MIGLEMWKKFKETFERDSGLKKPAAKGTFLFVRWRKSSGIEDALKDIDKIDRLFYSPGATTKDREKILEKWNAYKGTFGKVGDSYVKMLEDAIKEDKSDQKRHLEVLKKNLFYVNSYVVDRYKEAYKLFHHL